MTRHLRSGEDRFPAFPVISDRVPGGGAWKAYTRTLEIEARVEF